MTKWKSGKPYDNVQYNQAMLARIPNPESRAIFNTMVSDNPQKRLHFIPFQYSNRFGQECDPLPLTSAVYKCKPGSVVIAPLRLTLKKYTRPGKQLTFKIDVNTPFYRDFMSSRNIKFLFHTFVPNLHGRVNNGGIHNDDELLAMLESVREQEIDDQTVVASMNQPVHKKQKRNPLVQHEPEGDPVGHSTTRSVCTQTDNEHLQTEHFEIDG
jgi:hypothetical protein